MLSKSIDPRIYGVEDSLKEVKRILAVGSGKGGVGKSTISTFLSLVLGDSGFNVGLLDLDLFGPSTHLILNATEAKPNEYYGLKPVEINGIKFMSIVYFTQNMPLAMRGKEVTDAAIELLTITKWGNLDFLVIDTPPGLGDITLDILKLSRQVDFLLVSTPTRISWETVSKLIGLLKEERANILGLVENMMASKPSFIEEECRKENIRYLGGISFLPEIETLYGNFDALRKSSISKDLSNIVPLI
jgi:ATP-binding protein involved in chromosome partitioning